MSNIAISADAIALPRFDRSEVLRSAWKSYRVARPCINPAGDVGTRFVFLREFFAKMLRKAWAGAKAAAARVTAAETARTFVTAQSRVTAEKAAAISPGERSLRISQLHDEIALLDYAPLGARNRGRRELLRAELLSVANMQGDFPPML